jgi:hypothetical protein
VQINYNFMKQANNNSIHIRNNNCSSIKKLPRIEPILTILFPLKKNSSCFYTHNSWQIFFNNTFSVAVLLLDKKSFVFFRVHMKQQRSFAFF